MTLEERAEEYATNIKFVFETDLMQKVAEMYAAQAYIAGYKDCKKENEGISAVAFMQGATRNMKVYSKWHFVKDELPKEEGFYLVFCKGNMRIMIGKFEGGKFNGCLPIAWQPLPPIPTERRMKSERNL